MAGENEVLDAAADLVALWRAMKISGLSRADRNAAIEETRQRLIEAVDEWRGVPGRGPAEGQPSSKRLYAGSTPAVPATPRQEG